MPTTTALQLAGECVAFHDGLCFVRSVLTPVWGWGFIHGHFVGFSPPCRTWLPCAEHSDLAHAAPEHLSPSLGLCNFRVGPDQNASSRGAQALRKAEGQCVAAGGEILYIRIDGDGSIENSSAIDVHSDSTISSLL